MPTFYVTIPRYIKTYLDCKARKEGCTLSDAIRDVTGLGGGSEGRNKTGRGRAVLYKEGGSNREM